MNDGILGRLIVAAAKRLLPKEFKGSLELTLPSGQMIILGGQNSGEKADLRLRNFSVVWAGIRRAQLGFFERYMAGDVESRDPTAFFRFYLQNRQGLDGAGKGIFNASVLDKLWHRKRDNNKHGAKDNISAHYDRQCVL